MDNLGNESENNNFSKIASNFILVLKLQSEALEQPTFSTNIIDQLNQIFNQIQDYNERIKSNENCDKLLFQKIAQLIPNIEELINQNYLQFTVVSLQAKLNEAYTTLREAISNSPQANTKLEEIMNQVKRAVTRSYSCDFTKLSTSFFTDLRSIFNKLNIDLTSLTNLSENESDLTDQIPETTIKTILDIIYDSSLILDHLNAANSFISKTFSLIKSVKKIQQKNLNHELPLQSHKVFVCPSKPKTESDTSSREIGQITENLDKLINEFENDTEKQNKISEYSMKFDRCIKQEFNFNPPTSIFQNILRSITDIIIHEEMENDQFDQLSELFQRLSQLMLFYYQLPEKINQTSDISDFIDQMNEYETTIEKCKLNLDKIFIRSLRDFLIFCKFVKSAAETVGKVNSILGQNLISIDLHSLRVLKPCKVISFVEYKKNSPSNSESEEDDDKNSTKLNNISRVNAFRSLNVISNDIVSLRERGVDIVPDPMSYEIHPVSILPQIIRVRDYIKLLESQLFQHLCNFNGSLEIDESFLTTFEGIRKEAENFYAFVSLIPLMCVDLRIKTLLLYQQKFPIFNEESVQFLLNFYSLVYDIYGSFCKLNEIGTVPISSSIQLSYILTMCDDLADHYPCFDKYIEFFNSIDLFNINNDKVLQKFENLKKDLEISLSNWKSNDLIKKILKFSKSITESFEKLESNISDDFLIGLMKALLIWVQSDGEYRKKSNIKVIQIQMSALKKLISQKAKEDSEFSKLFDFDAIVSVCDLFAKLRERVEDKSKLRSFLAFVENSQNFDKSDENVPIDQIESIDPDFHYDQEETEIETETEIDSQNQDHDQIDIENKESATSPTQNKQKNKTEQPQSPQKQTTTTTAIAAAASSLSSSSAAAAKKKFNVFTNEKARQIWFDRYSSQFFENKKQQGVLECFLPSLIYSHFNNVVTKYCHFLSLGDSFDHLVHEFFSEMLQDPFLKYEITRDELHEYFASNHEQYKSFLKKAKGEINSQFDLTVQHLNEYAKTKNRDSHMIEISKKLSAIRSSYKFNNFDWLKELFQCYQEVISILKENASFTSLTFNLSSSFQRLNNMIYYCFLIRRCFKVLDSDHIDCQPDTSLHLILLDNFSESDHLISESSSMIIQGQIHFILEGEIGSNPIQLGTSVKILKLFGHIINLPYLLNTLECEFFNFEKFFSKLPSQLTSLQVLINSALFSSANYVKKSLFELISTRFTIDKYESTMRAFENLKSELKAAPFEVEFQQINDAISACTAVSDVNQICLIDDCMSAFCMYPEWDPENRNYVVGSDVLSLRMKMLSIRSKLVKLAKDVPDQYDSTMTIFLHNFSTSIEIPDNFGLYEMNDRFFTQFVQLWASFVSSLKPVDLSQVYDELRHSTRVIISVLGESGHKDITTLKALDQLFQTSHHPSLIFKMRLSFLYVQKQLRKYSKVFKENELPFDQVDFYLRVLHSHSEFCSLVRQITSLLNETVSLTAPIHCPTSFSIDHRAQNESESEEEGQNFDLNGNSLLEGHQLSFADQTSLAQMIHITASANQKCEEKFSNLPILVDEVNDLTSQVNESQKPIDNLTQIVAYMTELLDIISSQTPNHSEDKASSADSNSKENQGQILNSSLLKRDVSIISQHCHSMMHQYEDMVNMNLKVEEENGSLLNEYIVKYDRGLNSETKTKKSKYTKLFGLLNNSYDVVKNALDTMVVISNDKFTKGEFDSPFNRNLINVRQNRNPINLKLIFLKDKLISTMKEKGISLNEVEQDESKSPFQVFAEDFKNKDIREQMNLLRRLRNQLKNEIDGIKQCFPFS